MRYLIFGFLVLTLLNSCSGIKNNHEEEAAKIVGKTTKELWLKIAQGEYIYFDYQPNSKKIEKLKNLIKDNNYHFAIFAATYCDDCRENVPKLLKIFDQSGIDTNNYALFGLDHNLQEPSGYFINFDISTTPCLFILKNGKNIGKISYPDYEWLEAIIEIIKEDLNEN